MTAALAIRSIVVASALAAGPLLACSSHEPPFQAAILEGRLRAAGYTVIAAPIPDALSGYSDVTCIDAKKRNPLGPSVEDLVAKGKTWHQIIESAAKWGGHDLSF